MRNFAHSVVYKLMARHVLRRRNSVASTFTQHSRIGRLGDTPCVTWDVFARCTVSDFCTSPRTVANSSILGFSLFLPTILLGMGYQGTRAQLMSVPPYA